MTRSRKIPSRLERLLPAVIMPSLNQRLGCCRVKTCGGAQLVRLAPWSRTLQRPAGEESVTCPSPAAFIAGRDSRFAIIRRSRAAARYPTSSSMISTMVARRGCENRKLDGFRALGFVCHEVGRQRRGSECWRSPSKGPKRGLNSRIVVLGCRYIFVNLPLSGGVEFVRNHVGRDSASARGVRQKWPESRGIGKTAARPAAKIHVASAQGAGGGQCRRRPRPPRLEPAASAGCVHALCQPIALGDPDDGTCPAARPASTGGMAR